MHPILVSRRRLLAYLAAWVPLAALLVWLNRSAGGADWRQGAAAIVPACFLYAFACLSSWYLCRIRPLALAAFFPLAVNFAAVAAAGGLLLAGAGLFAAWSLNVSPPQLGLLFGVGFLLYLLSAGLHYAALGVESSRQAERRASEARTMAREAELQALRAQLNPHFLFNSLNSIAALATLDGERAREMCVRLADFLRGSLSFGGRQTIPLEEELALARRYLDVEQVRFGRRLRVEEAIEPACRRCAIPALLLQPLVENAVKHGISGLTEGGVVRLAAQRTASGVTITLENAFDPESALDRKSGLGLEHVRRRLAASFGDEAAMEAGALEGSYRVRLRLPCQERS
ncbi:MAG: histidine kinase [Bryobacteraceae bacterium]|jgi:GNAT superfamily N-acetyltransferase